MDAVQHAVKYLARLEFAKRMRVRIDFVYHGVARRGWVEFTAVAQNRLAYVTLRLDREGTQFKSFHIYKMRELAGC